MDRMQYKSLFGFKRKILFLHHNSRLSCTTIQTYRCNVGQQYGENTAKLLVTHTNHHHHHHIVVVVVVVVDVYVDNDDDDDDADDDEDNVNHAM